MILLMIIPYTLRAQEFDCEVSFNARQAAGPELNRIDELGPQIERYLNENRWTGTSYAPHERLRCRVQIVLRNTHQDGTVEAEAVFQLRRPIYNSMQETVSVLLSERNWTFDYTTPRALRRDLQIHDDLTSLIDFYAYILIGMDRDTFAPLGGNDAYSQALAILELAQAQSAPGWDRGFGSQRTRHGLIQDLLNPSHEPTREAIHHYHRNGLDRFVDQPGPAREAVLQAIEQIHQNRQRTTSQLFDIFFDAKYNELVALFRDAPAPMQREARELLQRADPGHGGDYDQLNR
ncbi:MAG: DUF4835 family protein [Balneolaceae bacterium]